MDPVDVFSSKAEKYAQFRWGYAPGCIQTIFEVTGINDEACVADIGAGTGILTREFIGKVKMVFAVEPNPEMRAIAATELDQFPSCQVVDGRAEATGLASQSVDLITGAQAMHWFEPHQTQKEFLRILKPGGWLAMCRNDGVDHDLHAALEEVFPIETDTSSLMVGKSEPRSYYYGEGGYLKQEYPFSTKLTWETFFGSLSTASYAPDEGTPMFVEFECGARSVFDRFSVDQVIELHSVTELYLGQMTVR
jgi:trans-aconitate methyltransferase